MPGGTKNIEWQVHFQEIERGEAEFYSVPIQVQHAKSNLVSLIADCLRRAESSEAVFLRRGSSALAGQGLLIAARIKV
jgi:hypothetical protein